VATTTVATIRAEAATASAAFDAPRAGRPGAGRPAQHLAELFEAHAAMVLGICRGMLRNAHDAEDAAQQTFLSAYTSLAGGTTPREPAAWLATIARNECRTRAHRRMREPLPDEDLEVAAGGDPAEQAVRSEEVESLRHALARLPGQQRHAFLLREFSGLSYEELADELGVTRPAVESLLFRARQQLRVSLRTALAAVTSAPMSFRDWLAQLFGSSPEAPAAAAKLGALAVVAKIAAATAGTAIVAAGVVAVAPHHHRGAEAAPPHRAPVRHAPRRATPVLHRTASTPAHEVAVRTSAPPRPVTTTPATATARHDGRSGEHGLGDGGGSSGRDLPSSGSGGGEVRTVTEPAPEHSDSSSGGGPGPSGDRTTTSTTPTTTTSTSGDGSHGSDGGGGDSGSGSGDGGSGGDGVLDSGGH
jgi:RNA polymerase sigma factor (sigma-70 family)